MPTSKIFFGLVILAVLGLGGYYVFLKYGGKSVENKTQSQKVYQSFEELPDYKAGNPRVNAVPENLKSAGTQVTATTVIITETGFMPANIKIKKGDIVTFTNEDINSHQVYGTSGLWFGRELTTGQSFSQEFDVPGVYPYNDKLNTGLKGEVTVD